MIMKISNYINQNYLHHAYLIVGDKDIIIPQLFSDLKDLNVNIMANPDLYNIQIDTFKMEDAKILKSLVVEKSLSGGKRIFLISANNFLLEAQNTLLKVLEEPIEGTHFFVISPSTKVIIPTLLSRFYVVSDKTNDKLNTKEAEDFIKLSLVERLDKLKELLAEDDEDKNVDSPRTKALKFLNELEMVLYKKMSRSNLDMRIFNQIFEVRKYLRQPGSATKTLMEGVALGIPERM